MMLMNITITCWIVTVALFMACITVYSLYDTHTKYEITIRKNNPLSWDLLSSTTSWSVIISVVVSIVFVVVSVWRWLV